MSTTRQDGGAPSRNPRAGGDSVDSHRRWWRLQQQEFPGFELVPHLWRLLAAGRPVAIGELAAAASWPAEKVEAAFRRHPGVDWDEQGRLVGFGLTSRPTSHRFTFDGRTMYAFCASDALMFPIVLGCSGVIESPSPDSGRPVRVEVTPARVVSVEPSTAVVSLVRPEKFDDVRSELCALGHFFTSTEAAAEWLAAYPEGMVHSVAEEFDLQREISQETGWAHTASSSRGGGQG